MKYKSETKQQSKIVQSESSDSSSDSQQAVDNQQLINLELEKIKRQLKNVPYQLIIKQQAIQNHQSKEIKDQNSKQEKTKKIHKNRPDNAVQRENKDAPQQKNIRERSFKRFKPIFETNRKKGIDPRFQTYAGNYNQDLAMKSYSFIPKMQEKQIKHLKDKLKNKKSRIGEHEREVLTKNYNQLTSDFKRVQLLKLERQTKKTMQADHGKEFHPKKKEFKEEFERNKLGNMSEGDREKKLREKATQIQKGHHIEKMNIVRNKF